MNIRHKSRVPMYFTAVDKRIPRDGREARCQTLLSITHLTNIPTHLVENARRDIPLQVTSEPLTSSDTGGLHVLT